ncbi:acyl-CoA N-acyltransferase [Obba rivulosa]|uniref:Acyl-CoA N-acyltransferase n=1 Tax=Obba rivulosa TaxID=1052685 RepID=A0A8E2B231_9APHY|nr:acyl-CoA N-acyltransferase [Obba rivulosa]
MRCNHNTAIVDTDVVLVPYRKEHVAKYHEWMQDPELQELTASEPLTLEEEYEMQQKWQVDEDKLTFIVLARDGVTFPNSPTLQDLRALPMIGDVNLFLKGSPDEEDFEVEAEVMIAEKAYRRRGLASRALQLLLSYATSCSAPPLPIPRARLVVRIGEANEASRGLFEKLGFEVTKRVEVFQEIEMRFRKEDVVWRAGEEVTFGEELDEWRS